MAAAVASQAAAFFTHSRMPEEIQACSKPEVMQPEKVEVEVEAPPPAPQPIKKEEEEEVKPEAEEQEEEEVKPAPIEAAVLRKKQRKP